MYNILRKILPGIKKFEEIAKYTDIKDIKKTVSFVFILSLIVSIGLIFLTLKFPWFYSVATFFISFGVLSLISYTYFVLIADKKASAIEAVIPDALQLMASNLRAGLTTDRALINSARDEFGPLQAELKRVGREINAGKDIKESLLSLSTRVKSDILERTMSLIVFGLRSGGELSPLLEEAAASLRQQILTQKQMRTNVMMYTIFIFIAIAFVSPVLFALSSALIETLMKSISMIEVPEQAVRAALPLTISVLNIEPEFVLFFSLIVLIVTTILGSLVLGQILTGEERNGLKFMPVLLIICVAVFFIVRILLRGMLTAFF
ncbi:type II secretion system F family protein [Candidatus Pacearchaeota archaeon]|nr:type II secretion system F family protein [Candidatus Pacearchaeota archaeon]